MTMADLGIEQRDAIATEARNNAELIAETFSEAFAVPHTFEVGEPAILGWRAWPETWGHPGLIIALPIADQAAIMLLPDPDAALPAWCEHPDPAGQAAIQALTAAVASLVLPPTYRSLEAFSVHVPNVAEALEQGSGDTLGTIPITLQSSQGTISGSLVLPITNWKSLLPKVAETAAISPGITADSGPHTDFDEPADFADPHDRLEHDLPRLPSYVRSLLRVPVTVAVTLAHTRTALSKVIDIGPGTIIQFDKSCESPLSLEVGDVEIANGEAVKIGDKFGLKVGEIVLPPERFHRVTGRGRRVG